MGTESIGRSAYSPKEFTPHEQEVVMPPTRSWHRYRLTCPETGETVDVLTDWQVENGRKRLVGASCSRPGLKDLSGKPCRWKCWQKIYREKSLPPSSDSG
jgi:hypothetical protein